ncbi:MAG TPA: hypothetical protein VF132_01740, partial [Rudaea sp.]
MLFQKKDMFSRASCSNSNEGEILYAMVPDPTGSVNSNVRTWSFVYGNVEPNLVHYFEHLDNAFRRVYVNSIAPFEETWLDEAMAWEAQELVFFNVSLGLAPRSNIVVSNLTTGPNASRRVAAFNTFDNPLFNGVYNYFMSPGSAFSNAPMGPFNQQGYGTDAGAFAITGFFLRYALDRKNADATGDQATLKSLVDTQSTGIANLSAVFGADMQDWLNDFLVALYTDDAVAPVATQYTAPSWNYRSLFTALRTSYPLPVKPLSDGTPLSLTFNYGGGTQYARFGVAAGQTATVTLTAGGVTPTDPIRTALIRTK